MMERYQFGTPRPAVDVNPLAADPVIQELLGRDIELQLLERYSGMIAESGDPDVPRALFRDVAGFMMRYILDGAALRAVS